MPAWRRGTRRFRTGRSALAGFGRFGLGADRYWNGRRSRRDTIFVVSLLRTPVVLDALWFHVDRLRNRRSARPGAYGTRLRFHGLLYSLSQRPIGINAPVRLPDAMFARLFRESRTGCCGRRRRRSVAAGRDARRQCRGGHLQHGRTLLRHEQHAHRHGGVLDDLAVRRQLAGGRVHFEHRDRA